jgi:hypothetical protein
MGSEQFYATLPVREKFLDIANLSSYSDLPGDWSVVIADVRNSTKAIQRGEYKAVNVIGVSVITAILNILKPLAIPYIFGGDGASLCIPGAYVPRVRETLVATRMMAMGQYELELRIGIIPVTEITRSGFRIMVTKHRVSRYYIQAAFAGGGLEYAERIIKDDATDTPFRIGTQEATEHADYSGLECRWDNVPSKHGEIISLIIKARAANLEQESRIYNEIIEKIHEIYGEDDACRPVYTAGMRTTLDGSKLRYEVKTRTCYDTRLHYLRYWLFIRLQILMGRVVMKLRLKLGGIDWGRYKTDAVNNADYRKFDGVLREVLSGTPQQRQALTAYLEVRFNKGECAYGVHSSNSALITCLINNRSGGHFHFIDGADGGYAIAAAALKQRLAGVGPR